MGEEENECEREGWEETRGREAQQKIRLWSQYISVPNERQHFCSIACVVLLVSVRCPCHSISRVGVCKRCVPFPCTHTHARALAYTRTGNVSLFMASRHPRSRPI